jgi:hypothetical protein
MKKILGVIVALLVLTTIAGASPIACTSISNLGQLIGTGLGCYLGNPGYMGDTYFTNFAYSASDSSLASQTQVNATSDQINGIGLDEALLSFNNAYSNATYTISFTAEVCTAALAAAGDCVTSSTNSFSAVQSELLIPNGQLGGGTSTWTSTFPTITQTQPVGPNAAQINNSYGSNPGPLVVNVVSVFGGTGEYETSDQLAVFQQSAPSGVPEPSTMLLMGGALVGLGVMSRKRSKKV